MININFIYLPMGLENPFKIMYKKIVFFHTTL